MYKNGTIRSVETIPGRGGIKEDDGGVNSTIIYCKNFLNVPIYPVQ
jgi:hypothetical protein